MERLGTSRRYQSSFPPDDPFDELYHEYERQGPGRPSRPTTPSPFTQEGKPTGLDRRITQGDALVAVLTQLVVQVRELTRALLTEQESVDGDEG